MSAVPTVEEARTHLVRWWMAQTVGLLIGVTTVVGVTVEAIGMLWVARTRPEWLSMAMSLLVVTLALGSIGVGLQVLVSLRMPREKGITARHPWPQRLVILGVIGVVVAASFLGVTLVSLLFYPTLMLLALLLAIRVDRALDEGRIGDADWWTKPGRWLVVHRGVGGRVVVERGDPDAVVATWTASEQDPAWGGRTVWLQHHVVALLEHEPDRALEVAATHVRARPMEVESHALLALCQLARGQTDEQTVPRLEMALQSARRLFPSLRHPHRPAILTATLAWAHAVEGRCDLAREQVERATIPPTPLPAAEVGWRHGRALLACGDTDAAQERFAKHAETVGWAGRRCAAELEAIRGTRSSGASDP